MGFKESVYKDALETELINASIAYHREKAFKIAYENVILRHRFTADFVIDNSILLEIKAASALHDESFLQILNYLKSSQIQLGLLINFGTDKLQFRRIICTH